MFNLTDTKEFEEFAPLPEGKYNAVLTDSEWMESKNTPGNEYLKLTFKVENRNIFENLTLITANEKARNIAMAKAKSILTTVGVRNFVFTNKDDLARSMRGNLCVKLGLKKETYNGEMFTKNVIRKFEPFNYESDVERQKQEAPPF